MGGASRKVSELTHTHTHTRLLERPGVTWRRESGASLTDAVSGLTVTTNRSEGGGGERESERESRTDMFFFCSCSISSPRRRRGTLGDGMWGSREGGGTRPAPRSTTGPLPPVAE